MRERTFLVTGAGSGIGRVTAQLLAKQGCTVLMTGRNEGRLTHEMGKIDNECVFAKPKLDGFVADLSRFSEVRELAELVSERHPVIHGILHNAANMDGDFKGYKKICFGPPDEPIEKTMMVNTWAPFLLTSLLLENVRASGAGRIVYSGSGSMGYGDMLDDLNLDTSWTGNKAYAFSKLCSAMLAEEMHQRYGDAPRLCFHTIDPGMAQTKIALHGASWAHGSRKGRHKRAGRGTLGRPAQGLGARGDLVGTLPGVRFATASFEALTESAFQAESGRMMAEAPDEVGDAAKRATLWEDAVGITDAVWPEVAPAAAAQLSVPPAPELTPG